MQDAIFACCLFLFLNIKNVKLRSSWKAPYLSDYTHANYLIFTQFSALVTSFLNRFLIFAFLAACAYPVLFVRRVIFSLVFSWLEWIGNYLCFTLSMKCAWLGACNFIKLCTPCRASPPKWTLVCRHRVPRQSSPVHSVRTHSQNSGFGSRSIDTDPTSCTWCQTVSPPLCTALSTIYAEFPDLLWAKTLLPLLSFDFLREHIRRTAADWWAPLPPRFLREWLALRLADYSTRYRSFHWSPPSCSASTDSTWTFCWIWTWTAPALLILRSQTRPVCKQLFIKSHDLDGFLCWRT